MTLKQPLIAGMLINSGDTGFVAPPRVRRLASGGRQIESGRNLAAPRADTLLNNVVEQDHRRIKQRIRPMLGFKRFETAAVTIRGIELAEKIKKQQFNLKPLTRKATTAPEL